MKFDSLLVTVGEFGPAQRCLYLLLSLPAIFYGIISNLVVVFLFAVPLHRCAIQIDDTYEVQSDAHAHLINLTIPTSHDSYGDIKYSFCDQYLHSNESTVEDRNITKPCNRWVYDKSVYESTASQSFDLVCSRKSDSTHAKGISMGGKVFGVLVTGVLSDRFGRRTVIVVTVIIGVILSICWAFVNNFCILLPLVFLTTACATTMYTTSFVYSMEIIGPSKRMLTGVAMNLFWSIGNLIVALEAFLIRDWRTRQLVLAVPGILIAIVYFLPESPRWLLRRGRSTEAERVMLKIAKHNNVSLSAKTFCEVSLDEKEEFWELFKSPIMMRRLMIVCFNWFSVGICYYGLSMNLTNLSGNIYLNFLLFTVVEAGAFIITLCLITRVHRKRLLCGSLMLAGISCITAFIPFLVSRTPDKWIVNVLACLGNTSVSAAFAVVFVFTAELMPTTSRNVGIGIGSVLSRFGSLLSPYINDLTLHVAGRYSQILPMLIFGCITIISGLLTLLLPETDNKRLPETIEDAEKLGTRAYDEDKEVEMDQNTELYEKTP